MMIQDIEVSNSLTLHQPRKLCVFMETTHTVGHPVGLSKVGLYLLLGFVFLATSFQIRGSSYIN